MNGFDYLAPIYDPLVNFIFGHSIKRATVFYFEQIKDGDKVLILGGGTGWILEELNGKNISVKYVDSSKRMLEKAKKKKVAFDAEFFSEIKEAIDGEQFDIIITPFFLDLFTTHEARNLVNILAVHLNINGKWLNIDFIETSVWRNKILLWIMYRFFNLTCNIQATELPDYEKVFRDKLNLEKRNSFYNAMILSTLYTKKTF